MDSAFYFGLIDRSYYECDIGAGKAGVKEVTVGIVAVFDGHNGAEASEMASKLLLEYFVLHTYFLIDASYSAILKKGSGSLQTSADHHSIFQRYNWDGLLDRHELDLGRYISL